MNSFGYSLRGRARRRNESDETLGTVSGQWREFDWIPLNANGAF